MEEIKREEDKEYDHDRAIEIITLHLVCTAEFQNFMGMQPWNVKNILIQHDWLDTIYLPGKDERFKDSGAWIEHFLAQGYQQKILAHAKSLYDGLPRGYKASVWDSSAAPRPSFSARANKTRAQVFHYQQSRQKILEVEKLCAVQGHNIRRSNDIQFLNSDSEEQQRCLKKLFMLQEAQRECREALSGSRLDTEIISAIDHLIARSGISHPADPFGARSGSDPAAEHQRAISWLMNQNHFTPRYENPKSGCPPFYSEIPARIDNYNTRSPSSKAPCPDVPSPHGVRGASIFDEGTLFTHLPDRFNEINVSRFGNNLNAFLNIDQRLPHMANLKAVFKHKTVEARRAGKIRSFDLLHDNLFHIRQYFQLLLEGSQPEESRGAKKTYLRMAALIAIFHGCTSEPAFFLTAADRLLNDLLINMGIVETSLSPSQLTYLGCKPNRFEDTVTHYASSPVVLIDENGTGTTYTITRGDLPENLISMLSHTHRRRQIIEEIAVNFRGCIVSATMTTWYTFLIPGSRGVKLKEIYESLLLWNPNCALCGGPLRAPQGPLFKRSIRIGTRDKRSGNQAIRSMVSRDRLDAYFCLHEFVRLGRYWSHSISPFFFYFSSFYHPPCYFRREKSPLLD